MAHGALWTPSLMRTIVMPKISDWVYPILCTRLGCSQQAVYKIAAEWSDGTVWELKTYGLACEEHLRELFARASRNQAVCRLAPGESLSEPHIYRLERGKRDRELLREAELEEQLRRELLKA
jgi:hypothetical protein